MKQESITVRILDREYPLLVDSSDVATIRSFAEDVSQRMRAFKEQFPDQPDLVAAVFISMELAEELLGARETLNVLMTAIDRETNYCEQQVSQALRYTSVAEG